MLAVNWRCQTGQIYFQNELVNIISITLHLTYGLQQQLIINNKNYTVNEFVTIVTH